MASRIVLPERYRVERHIASGGMASVWEVEDLLLGRMVAVKVLAAGYAADPQARARFAREARTAARVSGHPNIATIYDIGEQGDDAFIVMEYYAGGTVADRLKAAHAQGVRMQAQLALRWLGEAAAGIDTAHEAGIVHRDVKPANLLLDGADRLAVGDFGIARLADDSQMTQTGQVLGTVAYLSPEQVLGRAAIPASDRYALAVCAYELLTGRRPFDGGPPVAQARQHVEASPLPPSDAVAGLPAALDAVIARGLAKEPERRHATATELVAAITDALDAPAPTAATRPNAAVAPTRRIEPWPAPVAVVPGDVARKDAGAGPGHPPPPPPAPRSPAPARGGVRRPPAVVLALALAALLGGAAIAFALGSGDDPGGAGEPRATQTTPKRTQPTATTPPAPPPPQTPKQDPTPAGSPSALNDQGHRLNQAGRYAEAVPLLQASVKGFQDAGRTGELTYAFALFNLGVALNRSGDPAAAIEVLEERLTINNQLPKVRAELADARARLNGDDPAAAPADAGKPGNGRGKGKKDGG